MQTAFFSVKLKAT